jgi:hypothetical protein
MPFRAVPLDAGNGHSLFPFGRREFRAGCLVSIPGAAERAALCSDVAHILRLSCFLLMRSASIPRCSRSVSPSRPVASRLFGVRQARQCGAEKRNSKYLQLPCGRLRSPRSERPQPELRGQAGKAVEVLAKGEALHVFKGKIRLKMSSGL